MGSFGAAMMMSVSPAANALLGCTATATTHCLTDSYGTNILIQLDKNWQTNNFGSLFGFLELPPSLTGYAEAVPCPLKGAFVLDQKDGSSAWFTLYLESGCFCGDGGNPAFRVVPVQVNLMTGRVVPEEADFTSHSLRCDGTTEFMAGQLRPYPSAVPDIPFPTPDWASETESMVP